MDNTINLVENITGLQTLMDRITQHSHQFGLKINVHKKKQMIIGKKIIIGAQLYDNQIRIQRAEQYCYFGTMINEK